MIEWTISCLIWIADREIKVTKLFTLVLNCCLNASSVSHPSPTGMPGDVIFNFQGRCLLGLILGRYEDVTVEKCWFLWWAGV